jgi:hypothetical protein
LRTHSWLKFALLVLALMGSLVASSWAQFEGKSSVPRFNYNVGGGFGWGRGDVSSFVGDSYVAVAGAGMNFTRMFGFNGEYMYYDLTPKTSVADTQHLGSANGSLQSFSLNGLVRPHYKFVGISGYGIFGVGFYDRRVSSTTGRINPGSYCQPSWIWWDIYCVNNLTPSPNSQYLGDVSKIAGGYNFGGGATYPLKRWHNAKVYAEFRYHHAYQSDVVTTVVPITVGLRW